MKTKVSKIFMLCIAMIAALSTTTLAQDNELKKMEGEWTFSMPDMMGGGDPIAGTCKIATVSGETKATLANPMGEVTTTALKPENGKYVAILEIPDFEMKVAFYFNESKFMLNMISDFGEMPPMEMTRVK